MKLTPTNTSDNIALHCNGSVGCGNPFRQGDNTLQISIAVFLCLSVFNFHHWWELYIIMMVLFGQSSGLVAPCRGITTPFNTVTNTVVSIGDDITNLRQGITS